MLSTLLLAATLGPAAEPAVAADLVFVGGKVWTVDAAKPQAEAVAVWRDRVLKVGTDAEVRALVGPNTKVIDLKGRRVVPGFYDSHVHLLGGGQSLAQVDLKDAKDEAEFGRRLKEFDAKLPRDRWLVGGNWDHDRAFGGQLPTAATVDRYVKDRPVFVRRYDGHMALANTAALKLAGVTAATKEVPGGVVFRLADGKTPSGVLKDNAMSLVGRLVPEPDLGEIAEAVLAAQKYAASIGVTSVQDMDGSGPETRRRLLRTLQRLARDGRLTCRVDLRWPIGMHREVAMVGAEANFGSDWVHIGGTSPAARATRCGRASRCATACGGRGWCRATTSRWRGTPAGGRCGSVRRVGAGRWCASAAAASWSRPGTATPSRRVTWCYCRPRWASACACRPARSRF